MTLGQILETFLQNLVAWGSSVGIKIILALILLFVSFKLINWLERRILKKGEEEAADKTVLTTVVHILKIVAKCIVVVCLIGYLGIDISGITALIASLGFCVGLALNGTLSNIAGGVMLIFSRPFRVDDYIAAQEVEGTVEAIHLAHTVVITPDNRVVHVPNGPLSTGNIINYSKKDLRRVDLTFRVASGADVAAATSAVRNVLASHPLVLTEPAAPFVRMGAPSDTLICITARAWVKKGDYDTVYFDTIEAVKRAFDEKSIPLPVESLDVRIQNP